MAQAHAEPQTKAPWTKIFNAFKVALDLKKLALAAAGIVVAAIGWWLLGGTFFWIKGDEAPQWKNYEDKEWNYFKAKRASWNLMYELAGTAPTLADHKMEDAADVADSLAEYLLLDKWEKAYRRLSEPIVIKDKTLKVPTLINQDFVLTPTNKESEEALAKLAHTALTLRAIEILPAVDAPIPKDADPPKKADKLIKIENGVYLVEAKFDDLKKHREEAMDLDQIVAAAAGVKDQKLAQKALETFKAKLQHPRIKPAGLLRPCPWSEYRGANPYLVVADTIKTGDGQVRGHVIDWLIHDEAPVLLEPLFKFLMPLKFLFDRRANFLDRLYLILVILWTLAVWGFFGGAICRIAAVQIARNERISLKEAILFTKERFISYFAAPVFPMILLAALVFGLMIFGWIEGIPYFGDLFGGLLWPIVLIVGFIMAVVMVGLIAWPLMIATISTEGSDSFDALSRSYSYLYQAPWQLLWYNFLAVVYGSVLVFFVGFMASLIVFLGKWGVASAVGLAGVDEASDREPSYLFYYAPTSFGWRDLLISQSQFVETRETILPNGHKVPTREFTAKYEEHISGMNKVGAFLVAIWIYLFFLLVVGFGYSYFWSVSAIIYFLMRRHVDDTEMDEVYMENDELDESFAHLAPKPVAPAAPPPPSKPGTISLNVVESPPPSSNSPVDEAPHDPPPGANP